MAPIGPYPRFRSNGIDAAAEAFLASNKPIPDRLKELCSTALQVRVVSCCFFSYLFRFIVL